MKLSPRQIKQWLILGLILILTGLIALNSQLAIVHYTIQTDKVTSPVRIALITDLHSCDYGPDQAHVLQPIEQSQPDIVLLGGDIVDDVLPQKNAKIVLEALAKKYPTYYVSGNHEYWSGQIGAIKQMIRQTGITVLEGDSLNIMLGQTSLRLSGIDDPEVDRSDFKSQLDTVKNLSSPQFHILLAHRPELIDDYLVGDFDLNLSGHAHGGQWRIPGLLNGLFAPNQGFFPKYAGGRYDFSDTTLIVSRGLARETTRLPRLFNRPELVIIDVTP